MAMNKVIFKLWIDSKRQHLKHSLDLGILYSKEYILAQLDLLAEIEDLFNLEDVKVEQDYHMEKNY